MFNQIRSGIAKFFTKERVLILIIFIVLMWALYTYSGVKFNVKDGLEGGDKNKALSGSDYSNPSTGGAGATAGGPIPGPQPSQSGYNVVNTVNPSDLLPKDSNSQWSALNPPSVSNGNGMTPDLLQAGYHIGIDTIGQTLRNANLQLRSDPIIPKVNVGPWMQSTIEPDLMQVPLELNSGGR
jgi:hypothetical protein